MIALNIMIRYNEFKIGLRSKLVRASHLRSDMGGRLSTAKAGVDETERRRRRMKKQNTSELWLQYNILLCEIRPKTEHTLFCYGREYRNKLDTFIILSIKKK
jgi:hypothetical protein